MYDLGSILSPWPDLARKAKWAILVVLLFVLSGVAVKAYLSLRLKKAQELVALANDYRNQADAAKMDANNYRAQSAKLQESLDKANTKIEKLQAALDSVQVPAAPTSVPGVKDALSDLQKMGLELVLKPSVSVKPSVAGITADDTTKVWYWGQQALRVPYLETKIDKQADLIKGLDKAKGIAEKLADARGNQATSLETVVEKKEQETLALRGALTDTQKALKAERRLKIYYAIGAAATTYLVRR